jgi:hypothetical protein
MPFMKVPTFLRAVQGSGSEPRISPLATGGKTFEKDALCLKQMMQYYSASFVQLDGAEVVKQKVMTSCRSICMSTWH